MCIRDRLFTDPLPRLLHRSPFYGLSLISIYHIFRSCLRGSSFHPRSKLFIFFLYCTCNFICPPRSLFLSGTHSFYPQRISRTCFHFFFKILPLSFYTVSYTHLRAHETPEHLVCRLLLEKKKS